MALYPPIIASSMPPFDGRSVKIYFSLSDYNQRKDIKNVHLSLRRQDNNVNVINNGNEIAIFDINDEEDGRFSVELDSEDKNLIKSYFAKETIYKVQLRFSSVAPKNGDYVLDDNGNIVGISANFFSKNLESFSEWSTVCLIKRIAKPYISIIEFENQTTSNLFNNLGFVQDGQKYYRNALADFNFVYKQRNGNNYCTQPLHKWRLRLFDENNSLLADSDWNINSAYNYNVIKDYYDESVIIHCSLPYQFTAQKKQYKLILDVESKNGWTPKEPITQKFITQLQSFDSIGAILHAAVNEEEGYIKLEARLVESYDQNLVIRRSSSKDNFLVWEDIKHFISPGSNTSIVYYDFTVESGIFYKYLIQKIDLRGRRGTPTYATYETSDHYETQLPGIMGEWNHAFLLQAGDGKGNLTSSKQLKLKFDFQISNYKYNVLESKTDTLGSKYPFIKRNGDVYYRSFGCSGTISDFMDDSDLFVTDNILYDNKESLYKTFKGEIQNYTSQYDYIKEKKFREKVQEFLYNAKPKLYKSTQEGNILIKLMEVSLTPKNELGRLIYSFSATAYEIDSADMNSLKAYGFISPGNYDPDIEQPNSMLGNLTCYIDKDSYNNIDKPTLNHFKANEDLIGISEGEISINSIAKKIHYNQPFNNSIIKDLKVKWFRVTVESDPYIIIRNNGVLSPYNDVRTNKKTILNNDGLILFKDFPNESNCFLGTLANINGTQIIIAPPNNVYQVTDTEVISFYFEKDTSATIDYEIEYKKIPDPNLTPSQVRFAKVNGQIFGTYNNIDVLQLIKEKYRFSCLVQERKFNRIVDGVRSISIDTQPGTVIEVITENRSSSSISDPIPFIVNETGEISLDLSLSANIFISSCQIKGIKNGNSYDPVDAYVFYSLTLRGDYY